MRPAPGSAGPAREIELKLAVPARCLHALAAHSLLRGRTQPVTRRLLSTYYDTPALDLARRGVSLRVRRDGRRYVQTVKGGGLAEAGLHQRYELEKPLAGPRPDVVRLGRSRLATAFSSPRIRAHLRPLFTVEVTRSLRLLEPASGVFIEAALDRGEIRAGGRREALCELELELRRGEPRHLLELALALLRELPLALEDRSKAARGYALTGGERAAPVKSRPAPLTADMSIEAAFAAIVRSNLAHLQANEAGMLSGEDAEHLHQMRVAVRRLRSAFSVFGPQLPAAAEQLAGELRWLGRALSPARDWDVFMTETLPPVVADFGEDAALGAFAAHCAAPRRAALRKARSAVRSRRCQRLKLELARWYVAGPPHAALDAATRAALTRPVMEFAGAVLEASHAKVVKRGRRISRLSPAELHRLRIAIKKFRYAADFFAGLYEGKRASALLKSLSHLQNILGTINDAATVGSMLDEVPGSGVPRRDAEARGILLGWSRGRAVTLRRELKPAWQGFIAAGKFW